MRAKWESSLWPGGHACPAEYLASGSSSRRTLELLGGPQPALGASQGPALRALPSEGPQARPACVTPEPPAPPQELPSGCAHIYDPFESPDAGARCWGGGGVFGGGAHGRADPPPPPRAARRSQDCTTPLSHPLESISMEMRLSGHFAPGGEFCPQTFESKDPPGARGADTGGAGAATGGGGSGGGGGGWMAALVPWQREKAGGGSPVRRRRHLRGIEVEVPTTATNVTDYEIRYCRPPPDSESEGEEGSAMESESEMEMEMEGGGQEEEVEPLPGSRPAGEPAGAPGATEEVGRRLSFWQKLLDLAEGMKRKLSPPSEGQGKKRRHGSLRAGGEGGGEGASEGGEAAGHGEGTETAQAVQQVGQYVFNCISVAFVLSAFSAFQGDQAFR